MRTEPVDWVDRDKPHVMRARGWWWCIGRQTVARGRDPVSAWGAWVSRLQWRAEIAAL